MAITAEETGYLAGMLDGEGSVMLYRNSNDGVARLVIQPVTSTSAKIAEKVQDILTRAGILFGVVYTKPNLEKGFRGSWAVQIRRIAYQKKYIAMIEPYAAAKAEHLRLAGTFLKNRISHIRGRHKRTNRAEDELLIVRMKELNSRGLGSVTTAREPLEIVKIQSELFGDEQSAAEMSAPPTKFPN